MSDILCIYYSRTGNTKKAMEEIASALDAELAELRDDADRSGWKGWLRCGLDAMRRRLPDVLPFRQRPRRDYAGYPADYLSCRHNPDSLVVPFPHL